MKWTLQLVPTDSTAVWLMTSDMHFEDDSVLYSPYVMTTNQFESYWIVKTEPFRDNYAEWELITSKTGGDPISTSD